MVEVLIWVMAITTGVGSTLNTTTIESQKEYRSESSCKTAATALETAAARKNVKSVVAYCYPAQVIDKGKLK